MRCAVRWVNRSAVCVVTLVVGAAGSFAASFDPIAATDEFPKEASVLIAATGALFDDIEAELATPAAPQTISILGAITPVSANVADAPHTAFPADRGPVSNLTGYRINWYPVDRLLGVVDFMGTYDGNRNLVCGFVTWDMTDPSEPRLEHLAANYVNTDLLASQTAGGAEVALLNANCAFGQAAANFDVLVPSP